MIFFFLKKYFREKKNSAWNPSVISEQLIPHNLPPCLPLPTISRDLMGATAGGCLFACPLPGLLLQPLHYQCAPLLLAIFGSQAQKYAGEINNSFFEFGQEDRVLAPASSMVLGGLGHGQAGADRHPRAVGHTEHPAALNPKCRGVSPKLSTIHPFKDKGKERRPEVWWQP